MAHIHLTFYQRITLWNLIGAFQAPNLRATAAFLGLLEKIRPTDVELRDTQLVLDAKGYSWTSPSLNYGDVDCDLEADEAAALEQALETQEKVRVADGKWQFDLLDQLKMNKVVVGT